MTVREEGEADIVKVPAAVTVRVVEPLIEPEAAWMVVLPTATPAARPELLMVATEGTLEVHVAEPVRSWWLPSV